MKIGIDKGYYETGELQSEMSYSNFGIKEGTFKWYRKTGELEFEIPYKNDKKNGIQRWYFKNGKKMLETPFVDDKEHGVEKWYCVYTGDVVKEITYKKGKKQKTIYKKEKAKK